jgi:hypothetical protein
MTGGAIFKRKRYIAIKNLRKMPPASSAFPGRLMVKKSRVRKRRFPTGNQAVMPQRSSSATPKPTATERLETLPALALPSSSDYCQEEGQ